MCAIILFFLLVILLIYCVATALIEIVRDIQLKLWADLAEDILFLFLTSFIGFIVFHYLIQGFLLFVP